MALGSSYAFVGAAHTPAAFTAGPGFLARANACEAASSRRQRQQLQQAQQPSGARARALRTLNMSESESESTEMPEATKRLLEQAAKIRAEAEEMEIAYRKEQGDTDFVPTRAKAASVTTADTLALDPSNAIAQAAAAASFAVDSTPESRAALVAQLDGLPVDSKSVIEKMDSLCTEGLAPRWSSFSFGASYPISEGQLKMQTGIDGTSLATDGGDLDDLKWALLGVLIVSFTGGIGFGYAFPGNVGASITYVFALLPIIFLSIGSTAPGIIIGAINAVRRKSSDDYEERRVRHEAAHFLSGYLCGLPIKSYRAEGGTTLVEFYDSADGDLSGRALKFKSEEVDKVSIVAMSGAVCEAQAYGTATGGAADFDNLGQIMNQTNPPMDSKAQQAQARWATLMSHRLLSSHDPELKAIMEAFRVGKPVSECVAALEGARS